jgi:quercetin dioxygenase-like cupin family protein
MKRVRFIASTLPIVAGGLGLLASCALRAGNTHADHAATKPPLVNGAAPREAVTVTVVADEPIANVPGKRLVSLLVAYAPGASSAPHHHAPSAFIYAHVLSGAVRSQVNDEPVRVYRPGETWFEKPGAHHRVSANASDTEPARLLAVFIVDAAEKQLTFPDAR